VKEAKLKLIFLLVVRIILFCNAAYAVNSDGRQNMAGAVLDVWW
jgi:hypothetical protein